MAWRPRRKSDVDRNLPLSVEAGFVLAQLDGVTDLDLLADVTGLPRERLDAILEGLVACGAVEPEAQVQGRGVRAPVAAPSEQPEPSRDEEVEVAGQASEPPPEPSNADAGKGSYRALFQAQFAGLPVDMRVAEVARAADDELLSFAYDPDPRVIHALFDHPRAGLAHARLVAAHHPTSVGLDAVVSRTAFVSDGQVLRAVLKNPALSEAALSRLVGGKPLHTLFRLAADREVHERSRPGLRALLMRAYTRATPEERAELVGSTEGRCLIHLTGATFDARMVQILTSRPVVSAVYISNLARFRGTPPALLTHLLKQPFVRNNPGLRKAILAHPNTPNDERRRPR